jgi:hypothetical protein
MTTFKTLAAIAVITATLTTVTATGGAFAWEGGWRHDGFHRGYGFGRYDRDFGRDYSYRHYSYGYGHYGDCYFRRYWGCR